MSLETDYLPGHEDWIRELAARHPWDYLIGSVHYVSESWDLDNPKKLSHWKERDAFEVWSLYFERLTQAAASGLFEIIGHADLCKKFCFYPKQDCTPLFSRFLKAAKLKGVAMELNTAGLRKDCREIYPSPQIVRIGGARHGSGVYLHDAASGAWMAMLPVLFVGLVVPLSLISPRSFHSLGRRRAAPALPWSFQRPPPAVISLRG